MDSIKRTISKNKVAVFVILLVLGSVALFAAILVYGLYSQYTTEPRDWMFVAVPEPDEDTDLWLVRLGDPQGKYIVLARDVRETWQTDYYFLSPHSDGSISIIGPGFGGFVPNSDLILYWYSGESMLETILNIATIGEFEPIQLETGIIREAYIFPDLQNIYIQERRDDRLVCFTVHPGVEARRHDEGIICAISANGEKLFFIEDTSKGINLIATDIEGRDRRVLIEKLYTQNIRALEFSYDGSQVAYCEEASEDGQGEKVLLIDALAGEIIAESSQFDRIPHIAFPLRANGILLFISEDENGVMHLFTLSSEGEKEISKGLALAAEFDALGSRVLYLTENDKGERTVSVHDIRSNASFELVSSNYLRTVKVLHPLELALSLAESGPENDNLTLYSAGLDSSKAVEIYNGFGVRDYQVYFTSDSNGLFITVDQEKGKSLYYARPGQVGVPLLRDWASLRLLNIAPDGSKALISAKRKDYQNAALYVVFVEGEDFVRELDDDFESVRNAIFTSDGREVIYSVNLGGGDSVEIRKVNAEGKSPPETVYEGGYLLAAQWGELRPESLGRIVKLPNPHRWPDIYKGSSYCPGAPSLSGIIKIKWEGELCYRLDLEARKVYTVQAESNMDITLTLYDRDGNLIARNQSREKENRVSVLTKVNRGGVYYVKITSPSKRSTEDITLSLSEGYSDPLFDKPILLTMGQRKRDTIASESKIEIKQIGYSGYGKVYAFQGKEGQHVVVDVFADSINSSLDPIVYLLSPTLGLLGRDDDSGEGTDSRLTLTLKEDGIFFIIVGSVGGDPGTSSNYFYEVLVQTLSQ